MIPAGVMAAFLLGCLITILAIAISDRRAIAREAAWWDELRAQALDDYGRLFDWDQEPGL